MTADENHSEKKIKNTLNPLKKAIKTVKNEMMHFLFSFELLFNISKCSQFEIFLNLNDSFSDHFTSNQSFSTLITLAHCKDPF